MDRSSFIRKGCATVKDRKSSWKQQRNPQILWISFAGCMKTAIKKCLIATISFRNIEYDKLGHSKRTSEKT